MILSESSPQIMVLEGFLDPPEIPGPPPAIAGPLQKFGPERIPEKASGNLHAFLTSLQSGFTEARGASGRVASLMPGALPAEWLH